ncbi:MAG: prepilin peptidase [Parcubacteria group bacterium]|nr:prepilin peptidase [Parcubacteria group bacterium]
MLYAILFVLGAAWGSFLNVVACRLQAGQQFLEGRSVCARCRRKLHWHDLVPVVSFLALWGKCRFCKKRISAQYLLSELGTGALFVLGAGMVFSPLSSLLYLAVVSFFVVLFVYDLRTYVIPDKIVIPGIIVIGALNALAAGPAVPLLLGALLGGLWFLAQFLVSRGRWVGGGDIRLGVLMGALLGYPMVFLGLGIAYVGGSIIALVLIAARLTTFKSRLPFATLLLPAAFAAWLWGEAIWAWYRTIIGV